MKWFAFFLLFSPITFIGCHKKAVPVITTRTELPPPPPPPAKPKFANADLEAGYNIYHTSCVKCHDAKPVGNWSTPEWRTILISMVPKARLDTMQARQVTDYIIENAK